MKPQRHELIARVQSRELAVITYVPPLRVILTLQRTDSTKQSEAADFAPAVAT